MDACENSADHTHTVRITARAEYQSSTEMSVPQCQVGIDLMTWQRLVPVNQSVHVVCWWPVTPVVPVEHWWQAAGDRHCLLGQAGHDRQKEAWGWGIIDGLGSDWGGGTWHWWCNGRQRGSVPLMGGLAFGTDGVWGRDWGSEPSWLFVERGIEALI